jgi:hypothetical protein
MRFYYHLAYGPVAAGKAIVVLKIGEWFDNANVWIRINKSKKTDRFLENICFVAAWYTDL